MNMSRGWILVGMVAVMSAVGCGDNNDAPPPDAVVDEGGQTPAERGAYLMNVVSACGFCHTPLLPNGTRDLDKLYSGIDCFVDLDSPTFEDDGGTTGCLSTRNLTPDPTGLGAKTDDQIKNAFRNGVRTDGKKLVPIMPWYIFHNMSDDDADAIVAYLRSLPPVSHTVKPNQVPFSLYNDGIPVPQLPFIASWESVVPLVDNEIPFPAGGTNNTSAMRGRYLTSAVGLCIDCHTPEASPFGLKLDMTKAFAGGKVFPKGQLGLIDASYPAAIATRNLTSDMTGLGGWSKAQIKAAIAEGRDRDNKAVCAATHGGVISPYAALEPSDLDDIVEYLANLAPVVNDTATDTSAANCGPPPAGLPGNAPVPEMGADCLNGTDDDGDSAINDGCMYPCGNCQGPLVP